MVLKFLIIVPHGFCDASVPERHCDRRAMEEAMALKSLIESKNYSVDFFKADRYRSELDYNRKQAKPSSIRGQIRDLIKKYSTEKHHIIIFEMHSFPDNYTAYDFKGANVALLSIPRYEKEMNFVAEYIQKNTGLKIIPVKGTETNDIQWDSDESVSANINHYLIEFNENKKLFSDYDAAKIHPALLEGAIKFTQVKMTPWYIYAVVIILLLLFLFLLYSVLPQMHFGYLFP